MLDKLSIADFTPHLNQPFKIKLDEGQSLTVDLIEVKELGQNRAGVDTTSEIKAFSIVFKAAQEQYLPQQIYKIHHPTKGQLELFLVPVSPNKYEALFT